MQATNRQMESAILYQNDSKTVTLMDLPTSISLAQGYDPSRPMALLSCAPLQEAYPCMEPKSPAARANLLKGTASLVNEKIYLQLINDGLKEIREQHRGEWCLPRQLSSFALKDRSKKRKADRLEPGLKGSAEQQEPELHFPLRSKSERESRLISLSPTSNFHYMSKLCDHLINNQGLEKVICTKSHSGARYHIPPFSSFCLSHISEVTAASFSEACLKLHRTPSATAGPAQFDFVVLDPPWENRSVRRSGEYTTMRQHNPLKGVEDFLSAHLAPEGIIACWITNKAAIRDDALRFFETLGVELSEEWIWLKTTTTGEPVYDLDGIWRKPYEVLLMGRKRTYEVLDGVQSKEINCKGIAKRLIVAVPEFHSRKPNLKELIKPILQGPLDYRGLEIFARNLTAGWCAWGNEVLRFNWEGHWTPI